MWANWNTGDMLDKYMILKIQRKVRLHQIVVCTFWLILFSMFIYWGILIAIEDASFMLLASCGVYLLAAILLFRSNNKRIEKLEIGDFDWIETTVNSVTYFGSRVSRTKIYTDEGVFQNGESIFKFRKGMSVIIIRYNNRFDLNDLKTNLTFLTDPRAYIK